MSYEKEEDEGSDVNWDRFAVRGGQLGVGCRLIPLRGIFLLRTSAIQVNLIALGLASVVRCPLSVVGCRLSVVGCRLSVVRCRLSVVCCPLSVVGCRLSVVGCPLSVVGCRLSVVRCPNLNGKFTHLL